MNGCNPPDLTIFITDEKHSDIIKYIKYIDSIELFREFINNRINTNPYLAKLADKELYLDCTKIIPTNMNQKNFNIKWEHNYINFTEASINAKYRRDLDYYDQLVLTLFYVMYDMDLYSEFINIKEYIELEYGVITNEICAEMILDISFENNNMGQLYLSFYKQLKNNINNIDMLKQLLIL